MIVDICMLVDNDMVHDSRLHREASTLANAGWNVLIIAYYVQHRSQNNLPEWQEISGYKIWRHPIPRNSVTRIKDGILLRLLAFALLPINYRHFVKAFRLWKTAQQTAINALRQVEAKVYHAHDYPNLVAVHEVYGTNRTIIYDSHELYFDRIQNTQSRFDDRIKQAERKMEKDLAQSCESIITVGDKIADHLKQTFNVERPLVLRNVVDLRNITTQSAQVFPINNFRTVVHSGGITYGRRLHELIQSMVYLPDDVAIVLVGSGSLEDELVALAEELGTHERLFIVPPVQPHEVSATIAQADVAMVIITTTSLSYRFSVPNKYFEAIAAGLPVVTSLAPEIAQMTQDYKIGISVDAQEPQAIAQAILDILEPDQYQVYRKNVLKAREVINWEQEEKKLINLYHGLIGDDTD